MYTSYDEIWAKFLTVCGYDSSDIPQHEELIYQFIRSGVTAYNGMVGKYEGKFKENIKCDNDMEEVNVELSDLEIEILAYCISSIFASSKLSEFVSVWGVFAKETGIKDYKAQLDGRQHMIEYFIKKAKELIENEILEFPF